MKIKTMTLKEAETLLASTNHPFSEIKIRRTVLDGKLRANLNREVVSFYTFIEDD